MKVLKYRKKDPIVIEAMQFKYNVDDLQQLIAFCGDNLLKYGTERHMGAVPWAVLGQRWNDNDSGHVAFEGDYIIKENDDFYACSKDLFEKTYERVEE